MGLDRNELGAFLVAAGLASAQDHALASLLALNGLRISEALGANIADLGLERGHRTLVVHRKGGTTVTIPLAPRTARAVDMVIGERLDGPTAALDAGVPLRDVQEAASHADPAPPCATTGPASPGPPRHLHRGHRALRPTESLARAAPEPAIGSPSFLAEPYNFDSIVASPLRRLMVCSPGESSRQRS